jgi:hypothetical protein
MQKPYKKRLLPTSLKVSYFEPDLRKYGAADRTNTNTRDKLHKNEAQHVRRVLQIRVANLDYPRGSGFQH